MERCVICDKPDWRDKDCKIYGQGGEIQELLIDDECNWWDDRCSMWINSHGQRITGYIAESARHVKNVIQYFDNHPYWRPAWALSIVITFFGAGLIALVFALLLILDEGSPAWAWSIWAIDLVALSWLGYRLAGVAFHIR